MRGRSDRKARGIRCSYARTNRRASGGRDAIEAPSASTYCKRGSAAALALDESSACVVTSTSFRKVEAVETHHLVPRSHEVTHELLVRVVRCVDLCDSSQLGVVAEDQIDSGAGPSDSSGDAIATFVEIFCGGRCPPLRAHVEQIPKEVVGQLSAAIGEDA